MSREKELVKNTGIILFGTILPKLANIITLPIITYWLTKKDYGIYDLITTVVSLFLPVITLQVQSAAFRFLIDYKDNRKKQDNIISTILVFVMLVSVISVSILFFVLYKFTFFTRLLIVLYFLADIALIVLQQLARGLGKNIIYSVSTVVVSVTNMLLVVVTLRVYDTGLNGVLLSVAISTLLATIIAFFGLHLHGRIKIGNFSIITLKEMLSYSWPMIPNSLSNWVMSLSDRFVISGFMGLESEAVYSVACKIPNLFTTVQGTFVMAWQENASISAKDSDKDTYYSHMFDSIIRILFAIMSILIAFGPLLFRILIKGDYDEAYSQMPILYMAMFFSALASFLGGIYVALKQTKSIGFTTIAAAIINITIDLLFIKYIGIFAGSISTLVSYLALFVFRAKDIKRFISIKYELKTILSIVVLLLCFCTINYFRIFYLDIVNMFIAISFSCILNKKIIGEMYSVMRKKVNR